MKCSDCGANLGHSVLCTKCGKYACFACWYKIHWPLCWYANLKVGEMFR